MIKKKYYIYLLIVLLTFLSFNLKAQFFQSKKLQFGIMSYQNTLNFIGTFDYNFIPWISIGFGIQKISFNKNNIISNIFAGINSNIFGRINIYSKFFF